MAKRNLQEPSLAAPGRFILGCNYWASHAGTRMWPDWREDVVRDDLRKLSRTGLHVLRVFPLWSDFQPINLLRTAWSPVEYRFGETPLPDTDAGRAGVSEEMMVRFETLARLAQKEGLRLIVALVTGWMSGRLYVPPALEGRNPLTDPVAVQWEARFVSYFVRRMAGEKSITAWELGNECNCLAGGVTREQAWVWTQAITGAIRTADPTRPVLSGMDGLLVGGSPWNAPDQAELTDMLTSHPYPFFSPGCDQDPINTIRPCLLPAAVSRANADVGGKPCLCEELGTLGPQYASDAISADYVRTQLFSLWAHDAHGLVWWCGFEQSHLEHAPYDWCAVERELGLFYSNGKPKPVLNELSEFRRLLDKLPAPLPPRITDAVCILSNEIDRWLVAHNSFILAKQAGLEIEFQQQDQPLKDAAVYLLPCITGQMVIYRRQWLKLLEKVHAGATLYISHNTGQLSPFNEPLGVVCQTRQRRTGPTEVTMDGLPSRPTLAAGGLFTLTLKSAGAEVLGREPNGDPAFTVNRYGKGCIFFLTFPVELQLATVPGAYHADNAQPYWRIYQAVANGQKEDRHPQTAAGANPQLRHLLTKSSPMIGLTEHPLSADRRVAIAINYSPKPVPETFQVKPPWTVRKVLYGPKPQADGQAIRALIGANDALVWEFAKD